MKAFYILKPDSLERKDVIEAYKKLIGSQEYIKNRQQYIINSWVDLSCLLYEPQNIDLIGDEKRKLRLNMLTTIKGYDYLYPNKPAVIDMFDIPNEIQCLIFLNNIKYRIRKEYVLNTSKNYIKFLNLTRKMLTKELKNIDVRNLDISHIRTNHDVNLEIKDYYLAYMNCIHFPDPNIEAIERDIDIMVNEKVLTKKIIL